MPANEAYNNLQKDNANAQMQDIENMQNLYRGLAGAGAPQQEIQKIQQTPPPQQQAQQQQVRQTTGAAATPEEYRKTVADPAQNRYSFPTPATLSRPPLHRRVSNFFQRLMGGNRGNEQAMNPFGEPLDVTQRYGNRNPQLYADVGGVNRGTDLRTRPGRQLVAPRDLQVRDVRKGGWNTGWGNTVELFDPRSNEAFRFSHLADTTNLSPGDIVRKGMGFGTSGQTGRTTGPHIDLEYKRNNQLADVTQAYPEWFRG